MAVSLCPASRSSTVEAASTFEPNDSELALGARRPTAPGSTFGGFSHARAPCDSQWACRCCATTCFSDTRAPAEPDPHNTATTAPINATNTIRRIAPPPHPSSHVEKRPRVWYPTPGLSTPHFEEPRIAGKAHHALEGELTVNRGGGAAGCPLSYPSCSPFSRGGRACQDCSSGTTSARRRDRGRGRPLVGRTRQSRAPRAPRGVAGSDLHHARTVGVLATARRM